MEVSSQSVKTVSTEVLSQFKDMAFPRNSVWYSFPANQDEEYFSTLNSYRNLIEIEFLKKGLDKEKDKSAWEGHVALAEREAIKFLVKKNSDAGLVCPHELKEIEHTLALFSRMYDISDPRAYVIIRSVLSHQLSVYRMERYSHLHGPIIQGLDRDSNLVLRINPAEEAKKEFYRASVDAIAKLDQIFEGQKISADIKTELTVRDLMERIVSVDSKHILNASDESEDKKLE